MDQPVGGSRKRRLVLGTIRDSRPNESASTENGRRGAEAMTIRVVALRMTSKRSEAWQLPSLRLLVAREPDARKAPTFPL